MLDPISDKARDLIFKFEDLDQPGEWPGGESGVTIGIGYDLGYVTVPQFRDDWRAEFLSMDKQTWYLRLRRVVGRAGLAAKELFGKSKDQFMDIHVERATAVRVFDAVTVPRYFALLHKTFPGVDVLPADVVGVLFSLVYNRGGRLKDRDPELGDRREMRAIAEKVREFSVGALPLADALLAIAQELRSMERLWKGKGLEGLVRRREAEAELVESCIQ